MSLILLLALILAVLVPLLILYLVTGSHANDWLEPRLDETNLTDIHWPRWEDE